MAVTADKIVVELEAKLDRYVADIRTAQRSVEASMDRQAAAASRAEKQIKASAEGIRSALAGAASGIAAGVSVGAIQRLADSYTQFTNQLKTAGLEGAALAAIQERLFETAQKNGVELEALGTLYGRMSSAAKELKLNQQQQLAVTDAVAAALKIQGGSTEQASGALLQLSQALGGSKIQAEEYNSLIDGLRPLLQGVADASTKYGGSVAKLTAAVKDGKVTSAEFVQLIIKASDALENKAAKSTSTMSAGLTTLNNAFSKYIGETDKSLGLTERFGQAIKLVADNLETIIPGLTTIIAIIGVRYAAAGATFVATEIARQAALVRSTLATEAATAANAQYALVGLRASATAASMTASVSAQSVAMGVAAGAARATGSALLAAFGGPVGAAIIAITAAIGSMVYAHQQAIKVSEEYTAQTAAVDKSLRAYEEAAFAAATATGVQAKAARDAAAAAREQAVQEQNKAKKLLESARAELALAKAEQARAGSKLNFQVAGGFSAGANVAGQSSAAEGVARASNNIAEASKAVEAAAKSIASSDRILNAKAPPLGGGGSTSSKGGVVKAGRLTIETDTVAVDPSTTFDVNSPDTFVPAGGLAEYERNGGADFKPAGQALAQADEELQRYQDDLYNSTYDSIRGGLEAGFRNGLPGLLQYLGDELTRTLVTRLATALTEGILKRGGGGGDLFAIAGSLFGRANGGGVIGGRPQLVGERGPELFIPPQSGSIVPNGRLGLTGSTIVYQSVSFDNRGTIVAEKVFAEQRAYADRAAARAASGFYQQAMRDAPAAVAKHQGNKG